MCECCGSMEGSRVEVTLGYANIPDVAKLIDGSIPMPKITNKVLCPACIVFIRSLIEELQ
jgi:hypothetical protein